MAPCLAVLCSKCAKDNDERSAAGRLRRLLKTEYTGCDGVGEACKQRTAVASLRPGAGSPREVVIMLRLPSRNCNLDDVACPECGATCGYVGHGSYRRFLVTECGEEGRTIKRVRCRSCGATHAVIPDDVVPRKQYSAQAIESIRADRESGAMKIAEICERHGIGTTTLYRLTRQGSSASPDQHSLAIDRADPLPLSSEKRRAVPWKPERRREPSSEPGKEIRMETEIGAVIGALTDKMREEGFAERTVSDHSRAWTRLAAYAESCGEDQLTEGLVNRWRDHEGLADAPLALDQSRPLRSARILLSFAQTGRADIRAGRNTYEAPEPLKPALAQYRESLVRRSLSEESVRCRTHQVRKMLWWIGDRVERIEDLTPEMAVGYLNHLRETAAATTLDRARVNIIEFLRLMEREREMAHRTSVLLGSRHAKGEPQLPSVYSAEEIAALVEAARTDGDNPKRNTAMLVLVTQFAMRKKDVLTLTLDEIDWRAGRIVKAQSKTGEPITYHLTKQVKLALLDYLKNERPRSEERTVFLSSRPPHKPFPTSSNPIFSAMTRCFEKAGVDTTRRKHGPHALRHSLATAMLEAGVSYYVIGHFTGHKDGNMTRRYLSIDLERLRSVALEVPPCSI